MEQSSGILITAGGKEVQVLMDQALSKTLADLWHDLGIEDIEAGN